MKDLLDKLERLRTDRDAWNTNGGRQRINARVGDLLLRVEEDNKGRTMWQIEEFGKEAIVQPWSHANSMVDGMRECTDYTRAYVQMQHEPQPQEH